MALIKWTPLDPFEEMEKAFRDFQMPMEATFVPSMDMYKKGGNLIIKASIPEIDPKDIDVSVQDGVLKLKGKSEKKSEVDEKNYFRKEIKRGSFERSVLLPAEVDEGKAQADYGDGLLTVTVPIKKERKKSAPKKIAVKSKKNKK